MTKENPVSQKILKEIAQRAIATRLSKNISQIDLAEKSGISRIVIQRLEAGRGCTLENLVRIMITLSQEEQAIHIFPTHQIMTVVPRRKASKKEKTTA